VSIFFTAHQHSKGHFSAIAAIRIDQEMLYNDGGRKNETDRMHNKTRKTVSGRYEKVSSVPS